MLGPEQADMLNSDVFRLLDVSVDPQTHVNRFVAYTADLPRALDAPAGSIGLFPGIRGAQTLAPAIGPLPGRREILTGGRPGLR